MSLLRWTPPDLSEHREWRDVTTICDHWEVEMDVHGDMSKETTFRHRPMTVNGRSWEWVAGRPPTGPWRTRVWRYDFYPNHPDLGDPEDGDVVIYGRKGTGAGCGDPSSSIWMVPGSGHD
jgi:hypothetical protein